MTTTGRDLTLAALNFKIYNGDGMGSAIVERFQASEFQATLIAGLDTTLRRVFKANHAVLGARGDYLEIEAIITNAAGSASAETAVTNCIFAELKQIVGMPSAEKQIGTFGKISPFVSVSGKAAGKKDFEEANTLPLTITNNVAFNSTTYTTKTTQQIDGADDARIVAWRDSATASAILKNVVRITPSATQVLIIPRGYVAWADPNAAAQGNDVGGAA